MKAQTSTPPTDSASSLSSTTEHQASTPAFPPEICNQIGGLVRKLSHDPNLYEDLLQETLLCWWNAEVTHPGQTASWYKQRCRFFIQDYLGKGRSVDAPKHRWGTCSIVEFDESDAPAEGDALQQVYEHDILQELMPRLAPAEQQTLELLREELTMREIARELQISHVAVLARRRRIAAIAVGLGVLPSSRPYSPKLAAMLPPGHSCSRCQDSQ